MKALKPRPAKCYELGIMDNITIDIPQASDDLEEIVGSSAFIAEHVRAFPESAFLHETLAQLPNYFRQHSATTNRTFRPLYEQCIKGAAAEDPQIVRNAIRTTGMMCALNLMGPILDLSAVLLSSVIKTNVGKPVSPDYDLRRAYQVLQNYRAFVKASSEACLMIISSGTYHDCDPQPVEIAELADNLIRRRPRDFTYP